MNTGLTSPSGDDLDVLRQQYDRLCDLMTRTAESDPAAAERVLTELQSLSDRILALEASGPGAATPAAAAETTAAPAPPIVAGNPAPAAEARPTVETARVVAFRVTPGTDAEGKTAPKTASWRLDAPPAPPPAAPPSPAAAASESPKAPAKIAAAEPAPARPAAAPPVARPQAAAAARAAPPRMPAEDTAARESAKDAAANKPAADPTMFSAAIRSWLERHREDAASPAAPARPRPQAAPAKSDIIKPDQARPAQPRQKPASLSPAAAGPGRQPGAPAPGAATAGTGAAGVASGGDAPAVRPPSPELSRIAAAVEQQAAQIERILALCVSQQSALERLEAQILSELRAPGPAAAPDTRMPELHAAVEEQRQRLTALAKTIHNLAQWLAAERAGPRR